MRLLSQRRQMRVLVCCSPSSASFVLNSLDANRVHVTLTANYDNVGTLVTEVKPDVIQLGPIEADHDIRSIFREIRQSDPTAKIAVFTNAVDRESVAWYQDARADGCMDSASVGATELIGVLVGAATGRQPISREIADTLLRLTEASQNEPARLAVTATQAKILELRARGYTSAEVAKELGRKDIDYRMYQLFHPVPRQPGQPDPTGVREPRHPYPPTDIASASRELPLSGV